jgi:hypothetical protein
MYEHKRIYILVKTYPTISEKYAELVCTAGMLEDGSWIRLYPVPYRHLGDEQRYPKYTWIEANVQRNTMDFRPESYRPDLQTVQVSRNTKGSKVDWLARRDIILGRGVVYTNLQVLTNRAKTEGTSLAIFKPTKVLNFKVEEDTPDWNPNKLAKLQAQSAQMNFFKTAEDLQAEFRVAQKIPYKFSYRFEDDAGKQSTMMIEDWEIGMLYLNCLKRANGDKQVAIDKVKEKYADFMQTHDLYFFLGTTLKYHKVAPNPFIIIGVFYPPMLSAHRQMSMLDQ